MKAAQLYTNALKRWVGFCCTIFIQCAALYNTGKAANSCLIGNLLNACMIITGMEVAKFDGVPRIIWITEALIPLLQFSTSPRIINISSRAGLLKNISNEWARTVFSDIENLIREKIDVVLKEFLKDFKEGSLEIKGWPAFASSYTMLKAALNAYTGVMAKNIAHFHINCVPWLCQD